VVLAALECNDGIVLNPLLLQIECNDGIVLNPLLVQIGYNCTHLIMIIPDVLILVGDMYSTS